MDEINILAQRHGLYVVEDAAQSIGARYRGRRVGSLGLAAGFSLHPLKNLGVYGDGGLITTNDNKLIRSFECCEIMVCATATSAKCGVSIQA